MFGLFKKKLSLTSVDAEKLEFTCDKCNFSGDWKNNKFIQCYYDEKITFCQSCYTIWIELRRKCDKELTLNFIGKTEKSTCNCNDLHYLMIYCKNESEQAATISKKLWE